MSSISTPILLIAFNRPEQTAEVINSLRRVQPTKVYAAIDRPRFGCGPSEVLKNDKVIDLIEGIDWSCYVEIIRPEVNLGCKLNISQAISAVFEKEDRLIVIEDDIIAAPSFFYFAEEMLEKYESIQEIGIITANNYTPIESDVDYYFSKFTHIWGWALWKRTWQGFDVDLDFLGDKNVKDVIDARDISKAEKTYMYDYYKKVKGNIDRNEMNAWGPQFFLFNYLNGLLTITPKSNLAMNIGVESSRENVKGILDVHFRQTDETFQVTNHPKVIEINKVYDRLHFKEHIHNKSPFSAKLLRKFKKLFFEGSN